MYLIEATTKPVTVEDLGIFVGVNLPKTVSEEDFKSSVCLAELIRKGHLRASKTSLCREEIKAKPAKKKRSNAHFVQRVASSENPKPTIKNPEPIREERIYPGREGFIRRDELSAVVTEVVDKAVRSTVAALTSLSPALPPVYVSSTPVEPLRPPNKGISDKSFVEDPPPNGDAPMFIPSGLVPKDSSVGISVISQSQSSENLGDSAAALKKLRKGASK